jgi:hypothetical protein
LKWIYDNPTYKDRDDCSVRAFAKLLDKPYVDVKADLIELKRLNRETRYYYMSNIERYIKRYQLTRLTLDRVLTIGEFLEQHPEGRYLFRVKGHLATGIDGVLYDSWDSSNQRIYRLWAKI